MPTLDFDSLRYTNVLRCVKSFKHPLDGWSAAEWSNAAAGEMGEACNLTKKMIRHRDGVVGNEGEDKNLDTLREKLADEIADVVIYLDLLAASQSINLGAAVIKKFNKTSEKITAPERL